MTGLGVGAGAGAGGLGAGPAGGVELVVIGANGGPERSFGGSAQAAHGAEVLAKALPPVCFDTGNRGCRVTVVPPEADANTMLTALSSAARQEGRRLVVCLLGQLIADPRGRRLALVTAGSTPDNAYRRGLAWDWVVSTMVHGAQEEALLLVDAVAAPETWAAIGGLDGEQGVAELLVHSRVPLWGRIGPYPGGAAGARRCCRARRGRSAGRSAGSWSAECRAHPRPRAGRVSADRRRRTRLGRTGVRYRGTAARPSFGWPVVAAESGRCARCAGRIVGF